MAVLCKKVVSGQTHEVRSAGNSLRLYTDGVFHSQYNPDRPVGGNLWDLLLLPSFYLPSDAMKRILVLGVGGGTVMRQLKYFYPQCHITGVDINKIHLQFARQYFGVKGRGYSLLQADAIDWIQQYDGPAFDYIVDDLYGEAGNEPVRAVEPTAGWMRLLGDNMNKEGMLVMNHTTFREFRASSWFTSTSVQRRFPRAARLSMSQYDNVMGIFSKRQLNRRRLLAGIEQATPARDRRALLRLNYTLRLLKYV